LDCNFQFRQCWRSSNDHRRRAEFEGADRKRDIQLGAGPDVAAYNLQYPLFPIPAGTNEPWLMASEVQFNGVNAVPELSTWR